MKLVSCHQSVRAVSVINTKVKKKLSHRKQQHPLSRRIHHQYSKNRTRQRIAQIYTIPTEASMTLEVSNPNQYSQKSLPSQNPHHKTPRKLVQGGYFHIFCNNKHKHKHPTSLQSHLYSSSHSREGASRSCPSLGRSRVVPPFV